MYETDVGRPAGFRGPVPDPVAFTTYLFNPAQNRPDDRAALSVSFKGAADG